MTSFAIALFSLAVAEAWWGGQQEEQLDLFDRDLAAEPPRTKKDARLDLALDLSGKWQERVGNWLFGFYSNQWIWQECLEVTITGEATLFKNWGRFGAGGPLHHHLANGEYVTYDDTQTSTRASGYFSYKSIIAAPTQAEAADGASAVLVFYVDEDVPSITQPDGSIKSWEYPAELAVRYIDARGRLVFQQNKSAVPSAAAFTRMWKHKPVPCEHPHTSPPSDYCTASTSDDQYNFFTPACCADGYGRSTKLYRDIAHDKWADYVAPC